MTHYLLPILAQTASGSTQAPGGLNPTPIIYMVCIFVVFYFLMIRPQSQRQKQQEAIIKGVKTGDKVITASGIHGLVSNVKETTVILKIADNVKIEIEKSSIGSVVKRDDDSQPAAASS